MTLAAAEARRAFMARLASGDRAGSSWFGSQ
jgi:hypothetical protein